MDTTAPNDLLPRSRTAVGRTQVVVSRTQVAAPRHSKHAAARRAVVWGLFAFVGATVGYAVALDTRLPRVRYAEHGSRLAGIRWLQKQQPNRPLVVVIGSSRTQMALDPSAMGFESEPGAPIVFNYGLAGALPVHHPIGLRRLRAAGVKPAAVVVEIFPAVLRISDASQTLYAEQGAGLTGAELLRLAPDTHDPVVARTWLKSRLLPWSSFRREVQQQSLPSWVTWEGRHAYYLACVPDRFGCKSFAVDRISDPERRQRTEGVTSAYGGLCQDLRVDPQAERAYRQIVADCRAAGVPVAFYLNAESPLFHSWYTPESRAVLAAFLQMLTDELGAPVFDVSGGWEEGDFIDGHHMLPAGGAKFSRRFADVHLRPWFASVLPKAR